MSSNMNKKSLPVIEFNDVRYIYMEGSPFETIALDWHNCHGLFFPS